MRKIPSEALVLLISAVICAGCSVKEDRSPCPCMLVLDFSDVDTSVIRSADLVMAKDDGVFFTEKLTADDFGAAVDYFVPRSTVRVGVWSGADGTFSGNGLMIPEGEDCPQVYFHVQSVDADRESARETVIMRKNHCRLTVNIDIDDAEAWKVSLFGNVNGYTAEGIPSEGDFKVEFPAAGKDSYMVVLPRQTDDSLAMEIDDGTGVMKRFSLGLYIAESGFDWSAPDLEDLTVDIDVSFIDMTLKIQGWDKVYGVEVVI